MPAFVKLLAAGSGATASRLIDLESPRGSKLRLELKAIETIQLAELIRTFAIAYTCCRSRCGCEFRRRLKPSIAESMRRPLICGVGPCRPCFCAYKYGCISFGSVVGWL